MLPRALELAQEIATHTAPLSVGLSKRLLWMHQPDAATPNEAHHPALADARAEVVKKTTPIMAVGVPLGAASKRSGWILFVGVACFFAVRGTSQRKLALGDVVGAVAVGAAPLMVHDLLSAISYVVFDLRAIDPQNPIASNLASVFMTGNASRSGPAMLLRGLDLFELWTCWLMALGVSRVAQTRSSAPALITFGTHALLTLVAALTVAAT